MKFKNYIGWGALVLLALYILLAKPFSPGLNHTGNLVLGFLVIAISIWIFKPFNLPFSMGGIFFAFCLLLVGLPPSVVFSGFTQSAIWTLIPALFFGFVLQKTGLGKRIATGIIKLFPPSYLSLMLAWVLIGIVLSILTPAITVRVAIVMPIAVQCCELCRLEKGSRGNSLVLLTAFSMALLPGSGWISGALWGPIISGLFESVEGLSGMITFNSWLTTNFVPMELATLLLITGSYFILKPKDKLSADMANALKKEKQAPLSVQEKKAGTILVAVFLLFISSGIHGMPDAAVCLLALFAFFVLGVIDVKELSSGISWDLVIFLAIALSLGSVFSETGISLWLSGIIVPVLAPIAGNPWTFMFVIVIFMFLWRFIDIALFIPTMAVLVPVIPAIYEAYNIHPLVWITVFTMAGNTFMMAYQSMWALMSQNIAGDRAWKPAHLGTYGLIYFAACLVGLAVAVPMWISSGLF